MEFIAQQMKDDDKPIISEDESQPVKIIFLDIDGVLMTERAQKFSNACHKLQSWLYQRAGNDPVQLEGWQWELLDPECTDRLNLLIMDTGAKLVLSSSWRHQLQLGEPVFEHIQACGVIGEFIGYTPYKLLPTGPYPRRGSRWEYIQEWLVNFYGKVDEFVILDDITNMGPYQDKLVICDWYTGFGPAQLAQALEILGSKNNESS